MGRGLFLRKKAGKVSGPLSQSPNGTCRAGQTKFTGAPVVSSKDFVLLTYEKGIERLPALEIKVVACTGAHDRSAGDLAGER